MKQNKWAIPDWRKKPKQKGAKAESVDKTTVEQSVKRELITPESLAVAGDGIPVVISHRERKKRSCDCADKSVTDCKCSSRFHANKWLSDSAHNAMSYYLYCRKNGISHFY